MKQLRVARIKPQELMAMFDRGEVPVVLDVRTSSVRRRDPRRIPHAIVASSEDIPHRLGDVEPHREIVLYCT
jgi:rhodanese-related sulfurtransferase